MFGDLCKKSTHLQLLLQFHMQFRHCKNFNVASVFLRFWGVRHLPRKFPRQCNNLIFLQRSSCKYSNKLTPNVQCFTRQSVRVNLQDLRSHRPTSEVIFCKCCCTFPVAQTKRNTDVSMRSDKSGHRRSHIKPVTRCHLGHIPTNNTHLKHVWWVAHCHLTHVWTLPKTQHARNIAETLRSIGKDCAMMRSVMRSRPEWTGVRNTKEITTASTSVGGQVEVCWPLQGSYVQ